MTVVHFDRGVGNHRPSTTAPDLDADAISICADLIRIDTSNPGSSSVRHLSTSPLC
jgi:hypothetical protein